MIKVTLPEKKRVDYSKSFFPLMVYEGVPSINFYYGGIVYLDH
jgi:hypothetical protein